MPLIAVPSTSPEKDNSPSKVFKEKLIVDPDTSTSIAGIECSSHRNGCCLHPIKLLPYLQKNEVPVVFRLHAPQALHLSGYGPEENVSTFHYFVMLGGPFVHMEGMRTQSGCRV